MPRTKNAKNKPKSKDKKLYKIGQLSEVVGLSSRSIRYLDQLGLFPHMKRSAGKTRLFDEDDIALIREAIKIKSTMKTNFEDVIDIMLKKTKINSKDIAIICPEQCAFTKEALNELRILKIKSNFFNLSSCNSTQKHSENFEILKEFESLNKKQNYKHVFVILNQTLYDYTSSEFNTWPFKNVSFYITSGSISTAVVLAEQLVERILLQDSLEELHLLFKKQVPMLYQISYNTNCKAIMQNNNSPITLKQHPTIEQILNFKPVFIHQNGITNLKYCFELENQAQETIVKHLQKEIESRGNYCHRLLISSSLKHKETEKMSLLIKETFPDIIILKREMSEAERFERGLDSLVISIL